MRLINRGRALSGTFAGAFLAATVAACGMFTVEGARAAPSGTLEDEARIPIIHTEDVWNFRTGGPADQLVQRAREKGKLTVMVGLRIATRMEHTLVPLALAAQRRSLRAMQDGIVSRVFDTPPQRVDRFTFIPYISFDVNAEQLQVLLADVDVASVHEDRPLHPLLDDSVPLINADDVVRLKGSKGTGWTIAVLDTGVDKTHPMLKPNKVVSEACYSRNDPPNAISLCPGHVEESTAAGSGEECAEAGCDHGTHVASIAAGNPVGALTGVAPGAKIIAIQIKHRTQDHRLSTSLPNAVKALERVYQLRNVYKIAAVNISLGNGAFATTCDSEDEGVRDAIKNLLSVGIAVLGAAGNDSDDLIDFPACVSYAIAIGNTTKQDLLWRTSNHNALVRLLAPGTGILAAIPGGGYGTKTGTSQAAPHVAGAFALLGDLHAPRNGAAVRKVLQALTCSGKTIVKKVNPAGGAPIEVFPVVRRIDVLGAYNYLFGPPGVARTWNFADKAQITDWTPVEGNWRHNAAAPGTYEIGPIAAGDSVHPQLTALANCHGAFTVDIRFKRTDIQPFLTASGFWLKATIDYKKHLISGYLFGFDKAKNPSTQVPGRAYVVRSRNLAYREFMSCTTANGCSEAQMCAEKYVPISETGFNSVKIVTTGQKHEYFVNGTKICTFNDGTFARGAIVPFARILPHFEPGQIFQIDGLRLTAQDVSPL